MGKATHAQTHTIYLLKCEPRTDARTLTGSEIENSKAVFFLAYIPDFLIGEQFYSFDERPVSGRIFEIVRQELFSICTILCSGLRLATSDESFPTFSRAEAESASIFLGQAGYGRVQVTSLNHVRLLQSLLL